MRQKRTNSYASCQASFDGKTFCIPAPHDTFNASSGRVAVRGVLVDKYIATERRMIAEALESGDDANGIEVSAI
jgi:hypothetical protein